jgi:predicted  nucleic acid-binding Zn-ribbon protein
MKPILGTVSKSFEKRIRGLEKRETELKDVISFLKDKKELENLGLKIEDVGRFLEVERKIGIDLLERIKKIDLEGDAFSKFADAVPELKKIGFDFSEMKEVVKVAGMIKELGIPPSKLEKYIRAFERIGWAEREEGEGKEEKKLLLTLRRRKEEPQKLSPVSATTYKKLEKKIKESKEREERVPIEAEILPRMAKELERLKRKKLDAKRIVKILSSKLVEFHGLEGSIDELEKKRAKIEREVSEKEREVQSLSDRATKLQVEIEAKKFEVSSREGEIKKLVEEKQRLLEAIKLAKSGITEVRTIKSDAYDAMFGRLKKVYEAREKVEEEIKKLAERKESEEGELADIIEEVREFNRVIRELDEKKASLEAEIAQAAEKKRELHEKIDPVRMLWSIFSKKTTKDFVDACEWFIQQYRNGKFLPGEESRITADLRKSWKKILDEALDEQLVTREEYYRLKGEVRMLDEKIKEMVPRWKYESLVEELEEYKRNTVPKWKYDAQEEQIRFLSRALFDKEKERKRKLEGYI